MTPAEHARVKVVFSQAILFPEEQRTAFVQRQCIDQPQVLREVVSLLEHHRDATLLETPTNLPPPRIVTVEAPAGVDPHLVLADVWEDSRQILRRRLIIIACVLAVLIALSLVRLLTYHYAALGYGVRLAALTVSLGCAWTLHRNHYVSLLQLRTAECLVLANVGLLVLVIVVRLMLDATARQDAVTLISIHNWHYFLWTLIIFIYGIFMPNSWQRAAMILLPIAAIPRLTTLIVGAVHPPVSVLLKQDDFGMPIPAPLIASCIAIYAAHLIHAAKISTFQARQLAQYRLTGLIGVGGMGQVFEAEHLLLKRSCAIKIIQPERCVDDRALARFEREVRATAALTHPHTVEVYDYGQTKDGVFFYVMELLPGMNLRELVRIAGPLPPARAVHFLIEVCGALQESHAAGLIHRDLKPANIFASQRGGIFDFTKLLDFGVVHELHVDRQRSISPNMITGTPSYMSPEQITAPSEVDPRSDIYSLGAVAYYLLTGRAPFGGDSAVEIMLAHLDQTATPPSTKRPGIPTDLEKVVMRCLVKNPGERMDSAAQLRRELRKCDCSGQWSQQDAARWWTEQSQSMIAESS